jgi:uncharacterized protein YggU (UPF0235/DUF167 family)
MLTICVFQKPMLKLRAQENKANEAVIEAAAQELGIPRSRLRIVLGATSRTKVIEADC